MKIAFNTIKYVNKLSNFDVIYRIGSNKFKVRGWCGCYAELKTFLLTIFVFS